LCYYAVAVNQPGNLPSRYISISLLFPLSMVPVVAACSDVKSNLLEQEEEGALGRAQVGVLSGGLLNWLASSCCLFASTALRDGFRGFGIELTLR
jgi:hypothetical protein